MGQVHVTSFGYGHGPAPEADLTVDARRHLRNPHADPAMRELTGLDEAVRQHVLTTPGAARLIHNTAVLAADLHAQTRAPVTVAVGCVGGRHRSVAISEEIAATLRSDGVKATVTHRDVHRPVIQK
ncbi:RNase adapter RapZ [Microbispora sp. KK1-11]|uniref:RapZ C-terminal domain-containing protein n=1 Tax=Microbispora sp. KK1-11 TaxID=2053005 RepID=UPI001159BA57|nr:RNase adapter RapZ [Microbispora sp. KK1-11]TQS30074.1 ATPase [Microbispora sp. KK1-11]